MSLPPFALERWFVEYEFKVRLNLAASCAAPTPTGELLALAGDDARRRYAELDLDYIENPGGERLRAAVADWYSGLTADDIQITTGASEAIYILMHLLAAAGEALVVEDPCYQSLYAVAQARGVEIIRWPLRPENGFRPDLDELEGLLSRRVRAVVVNHPHNPTGVMLSRSEQNRLVELTERCGIWLVSDEVYRGTTYRPEAALPPAADLSEYALSIGDLTKPFGLGGLRIGWVACRNRELLDRLSAVRDYTTMCSAAPSEFLAALALENREQLLARKMDPARRNREQLARFIGDRPELSWCAPEAGFTALVGYRLPLSSEEFCRGLVERESVLLLPGAVFGVEDHFRIGFGRDEQGFGTGLAALGRYLDYSSK